MNKKSFNDAGRKRDRSLVRGSSDMLCECLFRTAYRLEKLRGIKDLKLDSAYPGVLFIPHSTNPGGVRIRSLELARAAAEKRRSYYLLPEERLSESRFDLPGRIKGLLNPYTFLEREGKISYVRLGLIRSDRQSAREYNKYRLERFIKEYDIQAVVNSDTGHYPFPENTGAVYLFDLADDHLGALSRSGDRAAYERLKVFYKEEISKADIASSCSRVLLSSLKTLGAGNPLYIPNGVEPEAYRSVSETRIAKLKNSLGLQDKWVIGCIGNHEWWSGLEFLTAAFQKLKKRMDDAVLLIIGPGEEAERLEPKYRNDPSIRFLGRKDPEDMPLYFRMIDVGTLPFEKNRLTDAALPIKILEYTAAGKYIVASPLEELKIMNLGNVSLAALNEDQWAEELAKTRNRAWNSEYDRIIENYTWKRSAVKMVQAWTNIIKERETADSRIVAFSGNGKAEISEWGEASREKKTSLILWRFSNEPAVNVMRRLRKKLSSRKLIVLGAGESVSLSEEECKDVQFFPYSIDSMDRFKRREWVKRHDVNEIIVMTDDLEKRRMKKVLFEISFHIQAFPLIYGIKENKLKRFNVIKAMMSSVWDIFDEVRRIIIRKYASLKTDKDYEKLLRSAELGKIRKVLICNHNYSLGNQLAVTPLLRSLKKNSQGIVVHLAVPSECFGIFKNNDDVDKLIPFDLRNESEGILKGGGDKGLLSKLRTVRTLRKEGYSLCLDVEPCDSSKWMTVAAGIRYRIGFSDLPEEDESNFTRCLNSSADSPLPGMRIHHMILDAMSFLGGRQAEAAEGTVVKFGKKEKEWAKGYMDKFDRSDKRVPRVVIHAGAGKGWNNKKWPSIKYQLLIGELLRNTPAEIIIVGSENERLDTENINNHKQRIIDMTGMTPSVSHLAALIDAADLFIGNNSGLMHVAAATPTPILALCGPSPSVWETYRPQDRSLRGDSECQACDSRICRQGLNYCMESINVGTVFDNAVEMLSPRLQEMELIA